MTFALDYGIKVVDVTKTLTAVHQTGDDGNFAAGKQPDHDINKQIAGGCVSQLAVNNLRAPGRSLKMLVEINQN